MCNYIFQTRPWLCGIAQPEFLLLKLLVYADECFFVYEFDADKMLGLDRVVDVVWGGAFRMVGNDSNFLVSMASVMHYTFNFRFYFVAFGLKGVSYFANLGFHCKTGKLFVLEVGMVFSGDSDESWLRR